MEAGTSPSKRTRTRPLPARSIAPPQRKRRNIYAEFAQRAPNHSNHSGSSRCASRESSLPIALQGNPVNGERTRRSVVQDRSSAVKLAAPPFSGVRTLERVRKTVLPPSSLFFDSNTSADATAVHSPRSPFHPAPRSKRQPAPRCAKGESPLRPLLPRNGSEFVRAESLKLRHERAQTFRQLQIRTHAPVLIRRKRGQIHAFRMIPSAR